ncbi:hypothetical protein [Calothrix sp. 336/3]|uniref:hypothetical protein n=1 Tax=Calothrix sp. 336/3 TaxID=1337936 RepID=UPI00069BB316|nr:hypothetical protein [Calothrix sp. 336/3]
MSGLFDDQPNNQLMPSDTLSVEVVQPEQQTLEEQREPLSQEELHLRLHLERKVERAFYEAGKALQSLRDRRLYRSTHKNFEEYCRDRFGFERRHPYRLIDAADVVDNLAQMCPNGLQILPTSDTNS